MWDTFKNLLTVATGSAKWSLNQADLIALAKKGAIAGAVAFVGAVSANMAGLDLGVATPLVIWALGGVTDFLRHLSTDTK